MEVEEGEASVDENESGANPNEIEPGADPIENIVEAGEEGEDIMGTVEYDGDGNMNDEILVEMRISRSMKPLFSTTTQ